MPLVHISVPAEKSTEYGLRIGAALHDALVEWLGVPADDEFRVVTQRAAIVANDGYLGVRRDDPVFLEITLLAGRSEEQKRGFYRAAVAAIEAGAGVEPRNVLISLRETDFADWSFGNGEAQALSPETRARVRAAARR